MIKSTDIIVIGGGHAGLEAASAAARMGANVLFVTLDKNKIGEMSCNPAIGGIGKGHIVREIDALGGLMPRCADKAGIQFKVLNSSKGPAVRGPRCQADRVLYKRAAQDGLKEYENIKVISGVVEKLNIKNDVCHGIELNTGQVIVSKAVVLTTGTFLNGIIYIGNEKISAGRINEKSSVGLGSYLQSLNLPMSRLKTGTPPRLNKTSINFKGLDKDEGDEAPDFFSDDTDETYNKQVPCYATWTNKNVIFLCIRNFSYQPLHNYISASFKHNSVWVSLASFAKHTQIKTSWTVRVKQGILRWHPGMKNWLLLGLEQQALQLQFMQRGQI